MRAAAATINEHLRDGHAGQAYSASATGSTLSGTGVNGSADEAGVIQFDGQGNVTSATYTITSSGTTPTTLSASGTYTVGSNCVASGTLTDSTGKVNTLNMEVDGFGQNFLLLEANTGFVRSGAAHSAFTNPTQAIGNVASYGINATPPGSVFALFGNGLAAAGKTASALGDASATTLRSAQGDRERARAVVLRGLRLRRRHADAVGYSGRHSGERGGHERGRDERQCNQQRRGGVCACHGDARPQFLRQ